MHILLCANPVFPRYFWKIKFSIWELKTCWFLDYSVKSRRVHTDLYPIIHSSTKTYTPVPNNKSLTLSRRPKAVTRGCLRITGDFKSNITLLSACNYKDFEDIAVKLRISYFIYTSGEHYFCSAMEMLIYSVTLLNEKSWLQLEQDLSTYLFYFSRKINIKELGTIKDHRIKI